MKRYYYISILITLFFVSCTKEIVITEDQLPEDVFYLSQEIKPYTGKCLIYYKDTEQVKEELHFKNGILEGKRLAFYQNGSIKTKGFYIDGKMTGLWSGWDKKGNRIFEVEYYNDSLEGKCKLWSESGKIIRSGTYKSNIKLNDWVYNN